MTQLNNLDIIKTTKPIAEKHDIPTDSLVMIDPQFVGGKLLESNADGSFKEAETVTLKCTFSDGTVSEYKLAQ